MKKKPAQAMLISILLVTATALAVGLAVAAVSSSELVQTVAFRQSSQAYSAAEACVQEQLMKLARADYTQATAPGFTGGAESCTISLSAGPPYTITATGYAGRTQKILVVVVNVNNPAAVATDEVLTIQSWQEKYE